MLRDLTEHCRPRADGHILLGDWNFGDAEAMRYKDLLMDFTDVWWVCPVWREEGRTEGVMQAGKEGRRRGGRGGREGQRVGWVGTGPHTGDCRPAHLSLHGTGPNSCCPVPRPTGLGQPPWTTPVAQVSGRRYHGVRGGLGGSCVRVLRALAGFPAVLWPWASRPHPHRRPLLQRA